MTSRRPKSPKLAPHAVADHASRGRAHEEPLAAAESTFDLDRQRILNCTAFRRLTHKTQVFVSDRGDHFRTRLTHTLEVVAQAQRLARLLDLNVHLAGAVALAHDLGHPPFGHAGESALAELMADHGGFEHNVQSLRVVDYLEHPYPSFRGLNLSFELRESLIKHRTPHDQPQRVALFDESARALLDAGPSMPLEGQVVNLADPIAYTLHDIEDGLADGILTEETLNESTLWRQAAEPIRREFASKSVHAIRRPILDNIARLLCEDATAESGRRIEEAGVGDVDAVRRRQGELIAFSPAVQAAMDELESLLLHALYRNHRVVRMDSKAKRLVGEIFRSYLAEPELMPERFSRRVPEQGPHRVICDYIAGMTDRFCQQEHRRLFAPFHFD